MYSFYQDRFYRMYLKKDDQLVGRVEDIPGYSILVDTIKKDIDKPKEKTKFLKEFNMVRFLLLMSVFVGLFTFYIILYKPH